MSSHNDIDKYEKLKPEMEQIVRQPWPDVISKYLGIGNEKKGIRIDYIGMRVSWLCLEDVALIAEGNAGIRTIFCDLDTFKRKLAQGRRAFQNA